MEHTASDALTDSTGGLGTRELQDRTDGCDMVEGIRETAGSEKPSFGFETAGCPGCESFSSGKTALAQAASEVGTT